MLQWISFDMDKDTDVRKKTLISLIKFGPCNPSLES
jgi:hypothetical protein